MKIESDATRVLRRAAVRASRASSVRNTEPWRFVLTAESLEIHADPHRRLRVLDPRGRQLCLSCGCALFNARTSVAFSGYGAVVERFPDSDHPGLVARIRVAADGEVDSALAVMDASAKEQVRDGPGLDVPANLPQDLVDALLAGAASEGAQATYIHEVHDLATLARICGVTGRAGRVNPASRAEMEAWTIGGSDPVASGDDGTRQSDWLPDVSFQVAGPCVVMIGGSRDDRDSWIHSGEALQRMIVEVARRGFSPSPMTQVLESASTDPSLRDALRLSMYPQALLAVRPGPAMPEVRRRRLVDVLTETG